MIPKRMERVNEEIREVISEVLRDLNDPRIGLVTVMSVSVSPDLRYADVNVSVIGDDRDAKSSIIAIRRASGRIRTEVGKAVRIKYTPELRFFLDESVEGSMEILNIIKDLEESGDLKDSEE